MLSKKLEEFEKALFLSNAIIHKKNEYDFSERQNQLQTARASLINEVNAAELKNSGTVSTRKKKSKKNADGKSTYDITLEMLESGMTPEAIAQDRSLTLGTIEGHLAKAVGEKRISIFKFMTEEEVNEIQKAIAQFPTKEFSSKDLYEILKGKFGYGKLRAVMVYQRLTK